MKININAGSGPQEIYLIKKTLSEVDDAVEQVEAEIGVKRGHWHKVGTFVVGETPEAVDFGGVVSGYAAMYAEGYGTTPVTAGDIPLFMDDTAGVAMDGAIYVNDSGFIKNRNLGTVIANGGYSSITITSESGSEVGIDLYVLN